jgi:hypothetical protein
MTINRRHFLGAVLAGGATLLLLQTTQAQEGKTQRVRFPKGRTSTILKGAVVRGTSDAYLLGAAAGQTMTVHVSSRENNATFTITAPDGATLVEEIDDWSGELPSRGDYRIEVAPTRGNATYTLEITIR